MSEETKRELKVDILQIKNLLKIILLVMSLLIFAFALMSGSEGFGGGITGIIKNSPNALPWLILLIVNYINYRNELIGGSIIIAFGIVANLYFNLIGPNFFLATFMVINIITFMGMFFVYSWYYEKKNNDKIQANPNN